MTKTERLRWIDLVARAIRIMSQDTIRTASSIEHFGWGISMMASMTPSFIESNLETFNQIEIRATQIISAREARG